MKKSKVIDVLIILGCSIGAIVLVYAVIGAVSYWNITTDVIPSDQVDALMFWILLLLAIIAEATRFLFQLASYIGNALEHLFNKKKEVRNE